MNVTVHYLLDTWILIATFYSGYDIDKDLLLFDIWIDFVQYPTDRQKIEIWL